MDKRKYTVPRAEVYIYDPEEGFAVSVALHKDYVLIEGNDNTTRRASDEITEYTDNSGEFTIGSWDEILGD